MSAAKVYRAIGLMSGTSLDGVIDVALLETDGEGYVRPLAYYEHPYDPAVRDMVRACFGKTTADKQTKAAEEAVTDLHRDAVRALGEPADIIGFHGQTITHNPEAGFTWQLGNGQTLAQDTKISVVCDLRQNDIKHGGQGAPLLPLYHRAMVKQADCDVPVLILNLGGVANITYIGPDEQLIAFDCGPANALMDDFIKSRRGVEYDKNGAVAAQGQVQEHLVDHYMRDPYFDKTPPKSLDRNHWTTECVSYASTLDGMATLLEMSVRGVARALEHLPHRPLHVYAAGGGRHNQYYLDTLSTRIEVPVTPIETLGWNGDATEAEGFAYLAVRSMLGETVTVPETTGAPRPLTGGQLFHP